MELILIEAEMRWFFLRFLSLFFACFSFGFFFVWLYPVAVFAIHLLPLIYSCSETYIGVYFSCWYKRRRRAKFIHLLQKKILMRTRTAAVAVLVRQWNFMNLPKARKLCWRRMWNKWHFVWSKWCKIASTHKLNINSGRKWWNKLISAIIMVDWTPTFTFRFGHLFFRQWKSRWIWLPCQSNF